MYNPSYEWLWRRAAICSDHHPVMLFQYLCCGFVCCSSWFFCTIALWGIYIDGVPVGNFTTLPFEWNHELCSMKHLRRIVQLVNYICFKPNLLSIPLLRIVIFELHQVSLSSAASHHCVLNGLASWWHLESTLQACYQCFLHRVTNSSRKDN